MKAFMTIALVLLSSAMVVQPANWQAPTSATPVAPARVAAGTPAQTDQKASTEGSQGGARAAAGSTPAPEAGPQSATPVCETLSPGVTVIPQLTPALAHARDLYWSGDFAKAIAEYQAIVAAGGTEAAEAYVGLTRVYLTQKIPAEAYVAAQKAVQTDAHLDEAHVALAEVYFRQGRIADSEPEFQVPLRNHVASARACYGLSRIYRATSHYKLMRMAVGKAHELDPQDPEIRRAWFATLGLKERIQALQEYLAAHTNDDEGARYHLEHSLTVMQEMSTHTSRNCRLKTPVESAETNLEMLMATAQLIRGYGLKVKFNNATGRLLLDTGASGILLNAKLARSAGIQRVMEQHVGGIGDKGASAGYLGFAESVQIGDLQFENCYVDVTENWKAVEEDGLIGADVFAKFLVDLDFPDRKFKLSPLPKLPDEPTEATGLDTDEATAYYPRDRYVAPEMQNYSKIYRFGHMLLIPTSVNDHPAKLFLIDTGASDNTIAPDAAREVLKIHRDSSIRVKGLSGEVKKVFVADDVSLAFAHFRQKKNLVAFDLTNVSNAAGAEVSGTLGFGMLFQLDIKIDYRDGLIDFGFAPNRFDRR
jgi:tetratricopeptide (TPR) repeat protein/predicted aspartyl protease